MASSLRWGLLCERVGLARRITKRLKKSGECPIDHVCRWLQTDAILCEPLYTRINFAILVLIVVRACRETAIGVWQRGPWT
jgi:hypothetical protein